ncbi:MAG: glycosyltransferase [Bdellovibrionales bacterium]|nr:glycosyltransferase [Bdellovibrionales bacterium]
MKIAFFGSSLLSSYWNGAATYYRGILSHLHRRGHDITFYEPDAFDRQAHRDITETPYARSVVYSAESERAVLETLSSARDADVLVKASGVGVFDSLLEAAVLDACGAGRKAIFWDVDAPATLSRLEGNLDDSLRRLLPHYDAVLIYGGGPPAVDRYLELGARRCEVVNNALDPETHHPVPVDASLHGDLGFLGNRLPDREARVAEFFFKPAMLLQTHRFKLGGSGWAPSEAPENVDVLGHVGTGSHNAFNCSVRAVINISRDSMAALGHAPATRLFEAAGAGACIVTDAWEGVAEFLTPGSECLVAANGEEVADLLRHLDDGSAAKIGAAARERVLAQHTYARRADQVESILE